MYRNRITRSYIQNKNKIAGKSVSNKETIFNKTDANGTRRVLSWKVSLNIDKFQKWNPIVGPFRI